MPTAVDGEDGGRRAIDALPGFSDRTEDQIRLFDKEMGTRKLSLSGREERYFEILALILELGI